MAKPGKETPGLSEASGSRPVTGFRASMISVEPTVVHSGQQDGDLGSERTTDEQTVEASGGSAPAGDPAEGEGVDAARFAELRLPTPLLAQLDAIAKQECNIQQVTAFLPRLSRSFHAARCHRGLICATQSTVVLPLQCTCTGGAFAAPLSPSALPTAGVLFFQKNESV